MLLTADLDSSESKLFSVTLGLIKDPEYSLSSTSRSMNRLAVLPKCCAGRGPFYGRRFLVTQCVATTEVHHKASRNSQT